MTASTHDPVIGFIGTGEITAAMVEGLTADGATPPIVLSPRSAHVSGDLAARFPSVRVAADNAEVADCADVVVIAVRPEQLAEALGDIRFRPGQVVVSLLAGVTLAQLRRVVHGGDSLVRAIPLTPVRRRDCVTPMTPANPAVEAMFDTLGGALVVAGEDELAVYAVLTGTTSAALQYAAELRDWAVAQGLPADQSETFVRAMLASVSTALRDADRPLDQVVLDHETAGGLNEQLRQEVWDGAAGTAFTAALDHLHQRVREAPHGD